MIVYGINVIEELLKSWYADEVSEIIYDKESKNKRIDEIIKKAQSLGIRSRGLNKKSIDTIAKTQHHQGILCDVKIKYFDLEVIIKGEFNVLLCDSIQDPNNLGAMIRSAVLFDFLGIIIPKDRSVEITPSVVKVSSGAVFHSYPCKVVNLSRAIETLKENGYTIIGLDGKAQTEINEINSKRKVGIVVGSEGEGLRRLVKEKCNFLARIPTTNKIDSLNASNAAAIAMYQIFVNQNKNNSPHQTK